MQNNHTNDDLDNYVCKQALKSSVCITNITLAEIHMKTFCISIIPSGLK